MSYNFFNPTTANDLAKFQGNLVGIQAGNAHYGGVAVAPTSIFNQAGYYALENSDTGQVEVKKLADNSLYTKKWYDQTFNKTFDFSGTNASNSTNSSNSTSGGNSTQSVNNSSNNNATNGVRQTSNPQSYSAYPYGNGTSSGNSKGGLTLDDINGYDSNTGEVNDADESADNSAKTVNAADIQELVDKGIYDSAEEALNATLNDGYTVPDDEQAKLGIYTPESEEKIQTLMDTYDISREEALEKLGDKAQTGNDVNSEYATLYNNFINNGFSESEAEQYLKDLGYNKPEDFETIDFSKYSEEDKAKIAKYMQSTGCSAKDAIKMTGAKEQEHKGLIRSFCSGVKNFFTETIPNFFSGIGEGFKSWIW